MDRVKYFYFTSIIWTIVVLSLLIVFFYNFLEYKSLEFTVKSTCREHNATREQCLCSQEFCVNKCCAWGHEPVRSDDGTSMYVCNFTVNETVQRKLFSESLRYYYTSAIDTAPKIIPEDHFKIYIDFLTSEPREAQQNLPFNSSVRLFQNGTAQSIDNGWYRSPSGYCLDTFFNTEVFNFFYISSVNENINSDCDYEGGQVLPLASISVSVVFFILTLLVYAVLPRLQSLRGKCLMCYFMCMLIADVGLLYFQLRDTGATYYVQTCAIMGHLTQFSFLSAFFWTNVISFDVWQGVSATYDRKLHSGPRRRWYKTPFMKYSIYAWGCPAVIVFATILATLRPGLPIMLIPDIIHGDQTCWFRNGSKYLFFLMPFGVLLCSNIILYAVSVRTIRRTMTSNIRRSTTKSMHVNVHKERLNICLKLIPMMGISWFLEIVSTILGANSSSFIPSVLDFFTSIQGVIIFVVFICNRHVLGMLSKKYCLVLYYKYFATNNDESTKTKETEFKSRSECPVESVKNETTTTSL